LVLSVWTAQAVERWGRLQVLDWTKNSKETISSCLLTTISRYSMMELSLLMEREKLNVDPVPAQ
jgi:hypothetical protein